MSYVYAVLIWNERNGESEVARVFTQRADAETFIATCREVETHDWFHYRIDKIELDGDPRGTF
jgi:hypothetical protein